MFVLWTEPLWKGENFNSKFLISNNALPRTDHGCRWHFAALLPKWWAICTMASFYYYYHNCHNPSGYCFLVRWELGWLNFNMKEKRNEFWSKGLFTWSGGPRSSGVRFLLFSRSGGHKTKETYPTRPGSPTPCKQGLSSKKMSPCRWPIISPLKQLCDRSNGINHQCGCHGYPSYPPWYHFMASRKQCLCPQQLFPVWLNSPTSSSTTKFCS